MILAQGKVRTFVWKKAEPGPPVADLGDVTLPDEMPVVGIVTDGEGKPAPGVEVIPDYDWQNSVMSEFKQSEPGRFGITYEGKEGEYHITVTADGYLDGESFLGRLASKQNLSGVVVKLARVTGEKAKEETTLVTGVVTRGGKAVSGGRVGGWRKRRKEMNRMSATILRGRTLPMWGYELVRTTVKSDGTFALENLKDGPRFGPWFLRSAWRTCPPGATG